MTGAPRQMMFSVADAAVTMGVSERTVWALIASGELASVEIATPRGRGSRKLRRVSRADIDAFIAAHRQPAAT